MAVPPYSPEPACLKLSIFHYSQKIPQGQLPVPACLLAVRLPPKLPNHTHFIPARFLLLHGHSCPQPADKG